MNTQYRIQERRFSPNIIEEGIEINGKITWRVKLAPIGKKSKEDEISELLLSLLRSI